MTTIILLLISYILVVAYLLQVVSSREVMKIKGTIDRANRWQVYLPVYGYFHTKNLPFLQREYTEVHFKYIYSGEQLGKRLGGIALITLLVYLVLIPISILFYISFKNNALRTGLITFGIILLILLNQGLTVDFGKQRGHDNTMIGLIGLIPIASFFIVHKKYPQVEQNKRRRLKDIFTIKNIGLRILIQGQVAIMAVIVIVPVIYIFGMAFSDARSGVPNTIWPNSPNFNSFIRLWNDTNFKIWYVNTLKIAIINMLVGTVLITGAAYVFARFSFKGKKAGLLSILVLQAFPSFMGLIAMYVLFNKFGLLGRPTALTILYIGGSIPGNLWLIKGFLDQIPKDLDESAMIDGASKLKIFTKIILPLSIPILTFVAVSMFMGPWMDYMLPSYLLNHPAPGVSFEDVPKQWTLAVGIFDFINDVTKADYSAFAAAALIVGVPIAVLYMVFQKYLIEGIMAGATKG